MWANWKKTISSSCESYKNVKDSSVECVREWETGSINVCKKREKRKKARDWSTLGHCKFYSILKLQRERKKGCTYQVATRTLLQQSTDETLKPLATCSNSYKSVLYGTTAVAKASSKSRPETKAKQILSVTSWQCTSWETLLDRKVASTA